MPPSGWRKCAAACWPRKEIRDDPPDWPGTPLRVARLDHRHPVRPVADGGQGLGSPLGMGLRRSPMVDRFRASPAARDTRRSEEHTSELQSLMRISYAVFCLKKKKTQVLYKLKIRLTTDIEQIQYEASQ